MRPASLFVAALVVLAIAAFTGCGGGDPDPDDAPDRERVPRCTTDASTDPPQKACL